MFGAVPVISQRRKLGGKKRFRLGAQKGNSDLEKALPSGFVGISLCPEGSRNPQEWGYLPF
jgi:hypothetical protein